MIESKPVFQPLGGGDNEINSFDGCGADARSSARPVLVRSIKKRERPGWAQSGPKSSLNPTSVLTEAVESSGPGEGLVEPAKSAEPRATAAVRFRCTSQRRRSERMPKL